MRPIISPYRKPLTLPIRRMKIWNRSISLASLKMYQSGSHVPARFTPIKPTKPSKKRNPRSNSQIHSILSKKQMWSIWEIWQSKSKKKKISKSLLKQKSQLRFLVRTVQVSTRVSILWIFKWWPMQKMTMTTISSMLQITKEQSSCKTWSCWLICIQCPSSSLSSPDLS